MTAAEVETATEIFRPQLVVGADGQNSIVRKASGLDTELVVRRRYGFRQHYAVAPWSPYMQLHWGNGCQFYVTPVSQDEIGVAVLTEDPKQRLNDVLQLFPEIASRLQGFATRSPEMGGVVATRKLKKVCRKGAALTGDASGSVDAITGEGIGLAVRQALALARAYQAGDLQQYQKEHARIRRRPALMASLLLLSARVDAVQRRVMASLAAEPELLAALLALHVGEGSLAGMCGLPIWNAGLRFLFA